MSGFEHFRASLDRFVWNNKKHLGGRRGLEVARAQRPGGPGSNLADLAIIYRDHLFFSGSVEKKKRTRKMVRLELDRSGMVE